MTNKLFDEDKAKSILKELKLYVEDLPNYSPDEVREAIEMAIQALESQLTDAVSRNELMKLYKEWQPRLATNVYEFGQALEDLPPVIPQRPKGKWIKVITNTDKWGETWHFKRSICGENSNKGYRPLENYCHNCGAEMSGGEEVEVSD